MYKIKSTSIKIITWIGFSLSAFFLYSLLLEPNLISIEETNIYNNNLYRLFHDKKIVHISDLHITSIGYREKKLIKLINHLEPDILFMTGDFLTNWESEDGCLKVIRQLNTPPYGIWAVMGNTDRYIEEQENKNIDRFIESLRNKS